MLVSPDFPSGILGIAYVEGHSAAPSGGYLVNFKTPSNELWSSALYDRNWVEASGYQFGHARQDHATNGYDEYLYVSVATPSTVLEFLPVPAPASSGLLSIYDVNEIDISGNAKLLVNPSDYTMDGKNIVFTAPSSLYVAEYDRKLFEYSKFVTFQNRFHLNYNWLSRPTIATDTGENEISIPFDLAQSDPSPSAVLLRVDPMDLRPGNFAKVTFKYPNYHIYDIDKPWQDRNFL